MAHIHEKIDYAADVFVVYEGKVLIRKHDKYDFWLGVGGHVELDEDPNQAAIREVKEEVGLDVVLDTSLVAAHTPTAREYELIPPYFLNRHRISDTHEHISFVYFAKAETDEVIPEKETDEWKWLDRVAIERNEIGMSERTKMYALRALEVLAS